MFAIDDPAGLLGQLTERRLCVDVEGRQHRSSFFTSSIDVTAGASFGQGALAARGRRVQGRRRPRRDRD